MNILMMSSTASKTASADMHNSNNDDHVVVKCTYNGPVDQFGDRQQ